ncbi:MAG: hypothetical protein GWO86_02985 [Planctomycetes bacterium]|nr:hypothetical protein [Planctomycetota bacterium]
MKAKRFVTAVLCVVSMAAIFAQAQDIIAEKAPGTEKIELKLNLQKGQKFGMLITTDMKISQTMNGQEMKMSQLIAMGLVSEVLDVNDDGIISIKMTYETMKGKMEGPMGVIEFDSTKPQEDDVNNPQAQMVSGMYNAMVGAEIVMKYNSKGDVVGIEGFDAMMDKMAEGLGTSDPNITKGMKDTFRKLMSEDKIEQTSNGTMAAFPDGPVGVGDIWYDTMSLDIGFPMDMDSTYVLKGRRDGVVFLDVVSKIDMGDEDGKLIEMNGMSMNMQMTGGMQGDMEVDEASGWMLRSKTNMQFSGVIKMAPNEQMPDGMIIPMSIIGTVTVEPFEIKN